MTTLVAMASGALGSTLPVAVGPALPVGLLGSIVVLCFLGCAHKQPEPPPARSREPVVLKIPPAEPAAAAPVPTPESDLESMLSGAILQFEFDRAVLSTEATQRLDRIAEAMKAHPEVRVKIAGHCDERGTQEYNLNLGQQRAQVARGYLIKLGINGSRVETVTWEIAVRGVQVAE